MQILIIRPGALGDVLLTLPALQALSATFPYASLELMGNLAVLDWLPGRSVVGSVSSFDRADLTALFQSDPVPPASLQQYLDRFDLIVSYATGPRHVFATNLARLAPGRALSIDACPGPDVHMPMSLYLQQPLVERGVRPDEGWPALHLKPDDIQEAAQYWDEQGLHAASTIAIHPGSGSASKNWPAERFAALARALQRKRAARLLLISGPADAAAVDGVLHCWSAARSPLPARQAPLVLRELPLPLLAGILSRCQLYVGNDSGVSHLAAALGVPTVAVFGPTDPDVWAPRGPAVRVVRATAPCAPCTWEQRQACSYRACLDSISVQDVMRAIRTLATRE